MLVAGAILLADHGAWAQANAEAPPQGTEWWYVMRARANMKIGNYRAAIESYEKAVELNPVNREALKQLGVANEKQGLTTKAIESYDRYLARFDDDPDIAFKQADFLGWERYAYRRTDAIRYYRMGLAEREDITRRHALARLLAQDRSQLSQALDEYRKLLAAQPDEANWRAEYRELLLWDPSHLDEAIREYRRHEAERPNDYEVERTLAEMIARKNPKSDEAAQRYAALVAKRPNDAKLRIHYAEILASDPRKRERALSAYREAVNRTPEPAVRESFADLLSASERDRTEAVTQYGVLVRARPNDVGVRLKLARLLSAHREDSQVAIAEYERVLAREPRNAEAHGGLSQAYAWLGDRDQALYHSNLSIRYGAEARANAKLRGDLLSGRERRVGPILRGFVQEGGSKTELGGVALSARGRGDLTPFLSLGIEVGFEDFSRSGDDKAAGFFELDAEYRLNPEQRIEFGLAYHSFTESGRDVLGRIAFASTPGDETEGGALRWRVGFERTLRFDSYTALVGEEIRDPATGRSQKIGAAREHRFFALVERSGSRISGSLEPYVGWVGARGISANPFIGVRGELKARLATLGVFELSPFYRANLLHYRDDEFGVDPLINDPAPGGYFSPELFVEQVPGLALEGRWGERHELSIEGGPAAQFVKDGGGNVRFELGGQARLAYLFALRDSIHWSFETSFTRIGDAYTRGEAKTSLMFEF